MKFANPRCGVARTAILLALSAAVVAVRAASAVPATPAAWPAYALQASHNADWRSTFPVVAWHYTVPDAAVVQANELLNPTMVRDLVGFAVGVAVVDGVVYASNNDGWLYALDARTGTLQWRVHAFNQLMGTPIVATIAGRRLVFVGAGNSEFAYSHAVKFAEPGARVVRGTGLSAMLTFDAQTGQRVWAFPTAGEDMPTPVFFHERLLFGNGDGHVYALDAATGKLAWKTDITSFVSMSSAALDPRTGVLVMGGTQPSKIYGLDAASGKLLWSVVPPGVFSSSAGDGTFAIAGQVAIGQIETQNADEAKAGRSSSAELAIDLRSGRIVWSTVLGSGQAPPRNKDAVPTVVDGVVYTGSPVTHHEYALDAGSGKVAWQRELPSSMKAAPTIVDDVLLQPLASGAIVTLDRKSGQVLGTYDAHAGGYGPQNGVAIGGTFFIGTNAGTLQAIPLAALHAAD